MSQHFPKPYEPFGGDINVKINLSNYATKSHLKNIYSIKINKCSGSCGRINNPSAKNRISQILLKA